MMTTSINMLCIHIHVVVGRRRWQRRGRVSSSNDEYVFGGRNTYIGLDAVSSLQWSETVTECITSILIECHEDENLYAGRSEPQPTGQLTR